MLDEAYERCTTGVFVCGLTFEVTGPQRRAAQGWRATVAKPLRARLTPPAVAGPVDRGVRRHCDHV
jgi:hypothetical protein